MVRGGRHRERIAALGGVLRRRAAAKTAAGSYSQGRHAPVVSRPPCSLRASACRSSARSPVRANRALPAPASERGNHPAQDHPEPLRAQLRDPGTLAPVAMPQAPAQLAQCCPHLPFPPQRLGEPEVVAEIGSRDRCQGTGTSTRSGDTNLYEAGTRFPRVAGPALPSGFIPERMLVPTFCFPTAVPPAAAGRKPVELQ
jgi:hypothetical protein